MEKSVKWVGTILLLVLINACQTDMKKETNPLLQSKFNTPLESIPFDKIENSHYLPAMKEAIAMGKIEIDAIINNKEAANFENTIVALDNSGAQLDLVSSVFFNLLSADSNDEMQQIAQEASPLLTEYSNDIMLNTELFKRVKTVYDKKNELSLDSIQTRLLEETYKGFVRNGALLIGKDRDKYREISTKLGQLSLKFGDNNLKETNAFSMQVTDTSKLAGLPDFVIEAAAEEAKARELEGYIFTLQYPSYGPFMQYSENRELREKMYMARGTECSKGDSLDNQNLIKEIVNLRIELANLFGYKTYADYVLTETMAENTERVNNFLNDLVDASISKSKEEFNELQAFANDKGANFDLMPWDWSYYSELLKNEKYSINDALIKPYFKLENVEKSVLELAGTLYGIKFNERKDIPLYHKDVKTYEVTEEDGTFIGVLYFDFFPRPTKQSGAWMTSFKSQYKDVQGNHYPHITIVTNFTKPTGSKPSLLTFNEVTTILHEFGHGLHGLLTNCTYKSQSGTSVARDFVELPSQFMENFAYQKEWLHKVAFHYETGEAMPDSLIDKIIRAGKYHAGSNSTRQLSLAMTDIAWHSLSTPFDGNVIKFEQNIMAPLSSLPLIEGCATSPTFGHIFAGGYAAGYYGYKWAEVLDADAFASLKEEGIFNKETANRFRHEILERGSSRKEMNSFVAFKGREPKVDALLERSGLK